MRVEPGPDGNLVALRDGYTPKTTLLVVLDGFGHRDTVEHNAIAAAEMPTWGRFLRTRPHTLLSASGGDVGLPAGQMGNGPPLIAAQHGQARAFLPQTFSLYAEPHWAWPRDRIHHQWHVFTDRNLYLSVNTCH